MKPLTEQEYKWLLPADVYVSDEEITREDENICQKLRARGLGEIILTDDFLIFSPNAKGERAVRIHRAYLESIKR